MMTLLLHRMDSRRAECRGQRSAVAAARNPMVWVACWDGQCGAAQHSTRRYKSSHLVSAASILGWSVAPCCFWACAYAWRTGSTAREGSEHCKH